MSTNFWLILIGYLSGLVVACGIKYLVSKEISGIKEIFRGAK